MKPIKCDNPACGRWKDPEKACAFCGLPITNGSMVEFPTWNGEITASWNNPPQDMQAELKAIAAAADHIALKIKQGIERKAGPVPQFVADEHGYVTEKTGWWKCLHCRDWCRPHRSECVKCGRPKGWLADDEVMANLGWVRRK